MTTPNTELLLQRAREPFNYKIQGLVSRSAYNGLIKWLTDKYNLMQELADAFESSQKEVALLIEQRNTRTPSPSASLPTQEDVQPMDAEEADKFENICLAHLDGVYVFSARDNCDELVTRLINACKATPTHPRIGGKDE